MTVSPDDSRMIDTIRPGEHPALQDVWPSLLARAQATIRNAMTNAQGYFERTQVLVRLVEQLQEQLTQREQQSELAEAVHS